MAPFDLGIAYAWLSACLATCIYKTVSCQTVGWACPLGKGQKALVYRLQSAQEAYQEADQEADQKADQETDQEADHKADQEEFQETDQERV